MARIDALPSIEIIRGFKGILDFYLWRGLPCVRAWPKYRPAKQTAASLAAALVFGAIVKSYGLLGDLPLEAYRQDALDQTRTARDIMVTGTYGNLHEASMSDFLTLLQDAHDFLSDLTALLGALHSIDTDELVVNVDQTVLPPAAATDAHQLTQITALQKLDDLQDALESKALDRFLVCGMDQLYSLTGTLESPSSGLPSGANGFRDSGGPGPGIWWKVTSVAAADMTNALTRIEMVRRSAAANYRFYDEVKAFGPGQHGYYSGELWLAPTDVIRVYFGGCLAGDTCQIDLLGHAMTVET